MLKETKDEIFHYFEDEYGWLQGEYKMWYENGKLCKHCFYRNDERHGEYKARYENGSMRVHCFYTDGLLNGECKEWNPDGSTLHHYFVIDGNPVPFSKLPFPVTLEDRMYFMLKYDILLLPVETKC